MILKHQKILGDYNLLKENTRYTSAVIILWSFLREQVFQFCFENGLKYSSTDEALFKYIVQSQNDFLSRIIHEIYTTATLLDYDNGFDLSKSDFKKLEKKLDYLINHFAHV